MAAAPQSSACSSSADLPDPLTRSDSEGPSAVLANEDPNTCVWWFLIFQSVKLPSGLPTGHKFILTQANTHTCSFYSLIYTRLFPTAQCSVFSKLSVCVDDSRISWDESLKDEDREISLMFQTQQWKGKKWLFLFELLKLLKWP